MSIWLELLVLLLVTYAVGIGIGWAIWGRAPSDEGGQGL
jgi:hypothetical protein